MNDYLYLNIPYTLTYLIKKYSQENYFWKKKPFKTVFRIGTWHESSSKGLAINNQD